MIYKKNGDELIITDFAMDTVYSLKDGKLSGPLKEIASKLQIDDNPVLMIARFRE